MSKKKEREKIVDKIQYAARLYKENLVGNTFLYVFEGRSIEVIFKAGNFKHLTGVDSVLSAKDFYKAAVRRKLQESQIFFSARHPYELCRRKMNHICEIAVLANSESFILKEVITNSRTYQFGTTDLQFTLCLNKEIDSNGCEKGSCYVVESLREGDCFSKSKEVYTISHIFVKPNDEKIYKKLLFIDKRYSVDNIPGELKEIVQIQ